MMDLSVFMPWVVAANTIFIFIGFLKTWLSSGEKALGDRMGAVEKKLVEHDRRVQAVEGELKHLPDRAAAHKLELALAQISGRLDTLDERLKPIAATSGRLQEFLLEQAQK